MQIIQDKYCLACGTILIVDDNWHRYNFKKNFYRCKQCINLNKKQDKNLKDKNKPVKNITCRSCKSSESISETDLKYRIYLCADCKSDKHKEYLAKTNYNVIKNRESKRLVIDEFGGSCSCCGVDVFEFLTIDHVNNDGAQRRSNGEYAGSMLYKHLISGNISKEGLALLCMNCNYSKGHNGFCPHKYISIGGNRCIDCNSFLENNIFKLNKYGNHAICKKCSFYKSNLKSNDKNKSFYRKSTNLNLKLYVVEAYGGKCSCCDEADPYFMTIDHVYGGGRKHFSEINAKGSDFYRWLKKNDFPKDDYRLLCYNCNCSFGNYGYCPHNTNNKTLLQDK